MDLAAYQTLAASVVALAWREEGPRFGVWARSGTGRMWLAWLRLDPDAVAERRR